MPSLQTFQPRDLALYHRNPRLGSVKVIVDSLRAHGQYKPVVVNKGTHTGRPHEVLAGNHTVKAFRELLRIQPDNPAWSSVDAYVVDVDEDEAARIVLVDNRSADLGDYDVGVLSDLLDGLPGLDGTGYTDQDLDDLLAQLEEQEQEPDDGLVRNKDQEQKAEAYSDVSTRVVVLQYPIPHFIWMQEQLNAFRKEHELDTNSDAVMRLLSDWAGSPPPALTVSPETEVAP